MKEKDRKYDREYLHNRYHSDEEFRKRFIGYVRKCQAKYPFRTWATSTISNHKKREIEILISRIELEKIAEQIKICKLCGTILEYGPRKDSKNIWNLNSASLDRIDCSKPLNFDNAQIICRQCNSAKSIMSTKEFIDYCKRVVVKCSTQS